MDRADHGTAYPARALPSRFSSHVFRPIRGIAAATVALSVSLFPAIAFAQAGPAVPVRVGGDRELAACEARGTLNGIGATDDGRVDIASGPTPGFRPLDRVPVGLQVYTCDTNGTFVGIIYGDEDCELSEPIARRAAYRGPCFSGWVHNSMVDPSDPNAV